MYLLAANPITQRARLSSTARLHSRLKTVRESLHGPLIRRGLWPLHSPDFIRCDFYRGEVQKITIAGILEEIRNYIRREISTISGQEFQRLNTCSAGVLPAFSREGNVFSFCCSTGGFLLDFLKVIVTANIFLAFTDC